MADVHDKATRSRNMSAIHGKDTKPEIIVRRYLHSHGFGYRKNYGGLPGKPDVVLTKYRVAVFVNGCFWHQHPGCRFASIPQNNHEFWVNKLSATVERDRRNIEELVSLGWRVLTIWECEINEDRLAQLVKDICFSHTA